MGGSWKKERERKKGDEVGVNRGVGELGKTERERKKVGGRDGRWRQCVRKREKGVGWDVAGGERERRDWETREWSGRKRWGWGLV